MRSRWSTFKKWIGKFWNIAPNSPGLLFCTLAKRGGGGSADYLAPSLRIGMRCLSTHSVPNTLVLRVTSACTLPGSVAAFYKSRELRCLFTPPGVRSALDRTLKTDIRLYALSGARASVSQRENESDLPRKFDSSTNQQSNCFPRII